MKERRKVPSATSNYVNFCSPCKQQLVFWYGRKKVQALSLKGLLYPPRLSSPPRSFHPPMHRSSLEGGGFVMTDNNDACFEHEDVLRLRSTLPPNDTPNDERYPTAPLPIAQKNVSQLRERLHSVQALTHYRLTSTKDRIATVAGEIALLQEGLNELRARWSPPATAGNDRPPESEYRADSASTALVETSNAVDVPSGAVPSLQPSPSSSPPISSFHPPIPPQLHEKEAPVSPHISVSMEPKGAPYAIFESMDAEDPGGQDVILEPSSSMQGQATKSERTSAQNWLKHCDTVLERAASRVLTQQQSSADTVHSLLLRSLFSKSSNPHTATAAASFQEGPFALHKPFPTISKSPQLETRMCIIRDTVL